MFIRTKFHINRLTQNYFTAFLYVLSDHPSYIKKINKKGSKIAFYVDVNVFSISNLTILKADISKTSSERYRFLFIFVYPQSMFGAKIRKISFFSTENFHFYNFKNLCILHGYVFIMSKMEDF